MPNETWLGIIPKYKYVYKDSYTETCTSNYDRVSDPTIEQRVLLTSSHLDGIQISVLAAVSSGHRLRVLLAHVPRAEELVFVLSEHRLRISLDLR